MNTSNFNQATSDAVREVKNDRDTAHRKVDQAADNVQDKAQQVLDKAGPAIDDAVKRGGEIAHAAVDKVAGGATRGATWVRESGETVKTKANVARERTEEYVREDPIKSVLMAAAAGALLYAITRALGGSDR